MDKYFKNSFIILIIIISIIYVIIKVTKNKKILGRPLWHDPISLIDCKLDGDGTSQQLLDIYSFSHITHGILFYLLFEMLNLNNIKGFLLSIIIEIIWEILENTPYIINKYREKPEYIGYKGDSIINSIGDTFSMIIGFYIAHKNKKIALLYLLITEIILIPFSANFLYLSFGSLIKN